MTAFPRFYNSPFLWFFLFLIVAEISATLINPYNKVPSASEVSRNPLPLRGWPEYLRAGKQSINASNIAIISNSQGGASEIKSSEHIYPALLERDLKMKGYDINIENWSLSGVRTYQIDLLSMVAAKRRIDLLLIIVSIKSLDIADTSRLGANADDLDLVAGELELWPQIHHSKILAKTDWDDLLRRAVIVNSKLGRLRPYLLDRMAATMPPVSHRLIFGHRRSTKALETADQGTGIIGETESVHERSQQPPEPRGPSTPASTWNEQFLRNRVPTFRKLFPAMHARLRESGTRLVWIWMPTYQGENTRALREGAAPAYSVICDEIRAAGIHCLDLTNSIAVDNYVTRYASSHLNLSGHKAMSQLLKPVIEDALHQP